MALLGAKNTLALTGANQTLGQGAMSANMLLGNGKTPQGSSVDFDNETKALLQKQQDRASETPEQIVARETSGMDEARNAFAQGSQTFKPQANAALGLNDMHGDLDQALADRASRKYQDASQIFKTRKKMDANNEYIQAQAQAAQAVSQQTRQKMEAYSIQLKNQAARKQARAQMLGTVLGAAGTVGGAAFGGPVGASAGGAVGSGVGQSVGGK